MLSWHVSTIVIGYILLVYINYTFCYCNQEVKVTLVLEKRLLFDCVYVYVHACMCAYVCACVCVCVCVWKVSCANLTDVHVRTHVHRTLHEIAENNNNSNVYVPLILFLS